MSDPGFNTPDELEANVDDEAKAVCQADFRKAVVRIGKPLRRPAVSAAENRMAHTGYHFVGPSGTNFVRHGVRSGIQVKNPTVDHGGNTEFVLGRTLAHANGTTNWVEAGWGEFSYYPDQPVAYACFVATCLDYTSQYSLTVGSNYPFRSHHCGFPGQNLVCGELWYGGGWQILGSWQTMRCTNADSSGNCRVENLTEVYSSDATHPTFGGGGMAWQNGMLKTSPSTFELWTTAFGTPTVYQDGPYVISWINQWYQFKACKDSC